MSASTIVGSARPDSTADPALVAAYRQGDQRAAAVAAAVWTGGVQTVPAGGPEAGSVVARLQLPLPELESLQSAELDSVLRIMDDSAAINSLVDDPGLGDLDAEELQRVLDTWEG